MQVLHIKYFCFPYSLLFKTTCFLMFLNDNSMLLIYFQGLGLIANDPTATAAEIGAFINHKPTAFCIDTSNLNIFDSCAFSFLGFLTNPNLVEFKSILFICLIILHWLLHVFVFYGKGLFQRKLYFSWTFLEYYSTVLSLGFGSYELKIFFFLKILFWFVLPNNQKYVLIAQTQSFCIVSSLQATTVLPGVWVFGL